jgi:hypothetical protein
MFRKLTVSAILGVLILAASCTAEEKKEDEQQPAAAAPEAAAPSKEAGPYYELTKDEITSHPDWTSMNVMLLGAKIGDKTTAVEKKFGKSERPELVGSGYYRSAYEKNSFSVYTYKMTGELQKIELYTGFADRVADPKFKKLLSTGDLDYMRKTFGMEEKSDLNLDTTGMEYIYDSKGFRFAQYNLASGKLNSLVFSKPRK